jgi:hypothetical protein
MKLSPTIIGTLLGVLGACLLIPALSGADNTTVLCWALGPVIVGFVIGLLLDHDREPDAPNDTSPGHDGKGEPPEPSRHPLNASGDFYVLNQWCISCIAPEHEAPDLIAHEEGRENYYHCYFKRQPRTPEETERAIMAVRVGCCGAVRYGGRDPRILKRFQELGAIDDCDHDPRDANE